jgi:hypothetical protein
LEWPAELVELANPAQHDLWEGWSQWTTREGAAMYRLLIMARRVTERDYERVQLSSFGPWRPACLLAGPGGEPATLPQDEPCPQLGALISRSHAERTRQASNL